MLGVFMRELPAGPQPFVHIKSAQALSALRVLLAEAGVAYKQVYRMRDFRWCHAEVLHRGGARLVEILATVVW